MTKVLNWTIPLNTNVFVFPDTSLESSFYVLAPFNSKIYPIIEIRRNILDHWFPTFENVGPLCNNEIWIPIEW